MTQRSTFLTAATALTLCLSSGAYAHNDGHFSDQCNIQFEGALEFADEQLTITLDDKTAVEFNPYGDVYVDGRLLELSAAEQAAAQSYYANMTQAVPLTVNIATDAVAIASTAVTEVFGELLGYDDDLTLEFQDLFEEVNAKMDQHFYAENGAFKMNSTSFEEGNFIDSSWETEFEEKVEHLIENSMGRILIAIGTEMLWGGGDMDAFEARMENFGESIEQRVEAQSIELEEKAEQLCGVLSVADIAETQLSNVPELKSLNLLDIENHKYSM
jgi:hypothetical protein